jgi:hypothetical protein
MRGVVTLVAAIAVCALIVFFGPGLAERAIPLLGPAQAENLPLIETLFTAIIFGPLLVAALAGGAIAKLNPLALGRDRPAMLAAGLAVGLGGIVAATGFGWLAGNLRPGPGPMASGGLLLWGSLVVLFAAAVEEVYFRGWLQPVLARQFGTPVAILLSAVAFSALHVMGGARSPTTLANLFLGGLLFGLLAARGGGIAGAVAAHFGWNWLEGIGFGLDPNPGLGSYGALVDLELSGSALWGGSEEGLNASLAMTLTLAALLVPMLILMRGKLFSFAPPASPSPAE